MLIVFCCTTTLSAETLNRVVAVVNDDVITQSELNSEIRNVSLQMRASGANISQDAEFKKKVLNHLIDKKLQMQVAKQAHITISDKELHTVIGRIAAQNQMTTSQLLDRIKIEGMNVNAYKENLREQLLLQKVQQQEIASKVTITPDEVDRAMHSNRWSKYTKGKSPAVAKKEIESRLLQEKFEEAGHNWLSKLRGFAYIEIKTDN